MFFHFEGFTRRYRHETIWSCEGIQDVQHQHLRQYPKGELFAFEPSSNMHIGWVTLSLLSPSCCLHDTSRERRSDMEIGSMDLHIEERSDLLDAPSNLHSCHDIEHWYTNTSIFVDCAHTCHARWTYHTHDKFSSYAWIDSHYEFMIALLHLVFPCHP